MFVTKGGNGVSGFRKTGWEDTSSAAKFASSTLEGETGRVIIRTEGTEPRGHIPVNTPILRSEILAKIAKIPQISQYPNRLRVTEKCPPERLLAPAQRERRSSLAVRECRRRMVVNRHRDPLRVCSIQLRAPCLSTDDRPQTSESLRW